ncbi:hypothetical protein B7764_10045 [Pantoea ananatis]|uniref:hypothetical protein n=1 Tax=Pantoea ananas TaxID=553 RepID=UPI000B5E9A7C|nr:hypothetical protein [Pantoea ananatis]ASN15524.1 hypothetical protein B7764_10045 [Pantoea ananatis]
MELKRVYLQHDLTQRSPAKDVRIWVENVRTVSHESGLDIYQCAADLTFAKPNMKDSLPITYRVQKTEDGKGQFYVNLYGL